MSLKSFIDNANRMGVLEAIRTSAVWHLNLNYWDDCIRYYRHLETKGRVILDIGSDYGTSPRYFILNGAFRVIGFSLMDSRYNSYRYIHIKEEFTIDRAIELLRPYMKIKLSLKADCEGCEWTMTPEFINIFDDWIIGLHSIDGKIPNPELYGYILNSGTYIGNPSQYQPDDLPVKEFAVYHKKKL